MKSLLFALGLALCCLVQANQDERFENMNLNKIEGDHYVRAMATNCQKMKEMLPRMPVSLVSFAVQSSDEVRMTMEMPTANGCKPMNVQIKKENGLYTAYCHRGAKKIVEVANVKKDRVFILLTLVHPKGECKIATLATRSLDVSEEAEKDFKDFTNRYNLGGEKTHFLSTDGMCQRSS